MSVTAQQIRDRIQQRLNPGCLEVIDESASHDGHAGANGSGLGTHFRVRLGGPALEKLTRLARHRLVYDAVQDLMQQGIHALAIEVLPSEQ
jgi:BolA protein